MVQHGITVLLINLDAYATVQVGLSVQNTIPTNRTSIWLLHQPSRHGKFTRNNLASSMRKEYHLTAKHANIHIQIVLLNGKILSVDSSGTIPPLEPRTVNPSDPITMAPFSSVFADIPNILVPACK